MTESLRNEVRYLLPGWLFCVLLPLPAIALRQADDGVPWRFGCFFVGCTSLVAYAFKRDVSPAMSHGKGSEPTWSSRLISVSIALVLAFATFSILCLALNDLDLVGTLKALSILLMSVCIAPYLTLVHRKPFIAVVFTLALVFCMKLLGCVVVVLVYGWNASDRGYTTTPWMHPNLLVWLFLLNTSVLSVSFYYAGKRKFRTIYKHSDSCCLAQS